MLHFCDHAKPGFMVKGFDRRPRRTSRRVRANPAASSAGASAGRRRRLAGVRLTPEERAELLAPGPPVACDGVPPRALGNFAQMIRAEAAREAASPSLDNLPESFTTGAPKSSGRTAKPAKGASNSEQRGHSFLICPGRGKRCFGPARTGATCFRFLGRKPGPRGPAHVVAHGCPLAFYSDRHGIFRVNAKDAAGGDGKTEFGRVAERLRIELITALTPRPRAASSGPTRPCRIGWVREKAPAGDIDDRGGSGLRADLHGAMERQVRHGAENPSCWPVRCSPEKIPHATGSPCRTAVESAALSRMAGSMTGSRVSSRSSKA